MTLEVLEVLFVLFTLTMAPSRRKAAKLEPDSPAPTTLSTPIDKVPKLRKDGQPRKGHKEHARWLPEDDVALFKACDEVKDRGTMGDNGFKARDWGYIASQVEAVRDAAASGGPKTAATCKSRLNKA